MQSVIKAGRRLVVCAAVLVLLNANGYAQTLKMMTHNDADNWMAYYQAFTDATGIEVEVIHQDWGKLDKLLASVAAGLPPDIVLLDSRWLAEATSQDLLMDLAPLIERDPNLNVTDFYPSVTEALGKDGALFGISTSLDMYAVWYNRGHFNAAGIAHPTNWTYDDYLDYARKLTIGDGDARRWGTNYVGWASPAYAAGGEFITQDGRFGMNQPEVIDAIQWAADLDLVGEVVPVGITVSNHARLPAGRVSMHWAGPWYLSAYMADSSVDWGIAAPPRWRDKRQATELFVGGWGIPSTSENAELAWKFIQWAASKEGSLAEADAVPLLPTLRSLVGDPDLTVWAQFGEFSSDLVDTVTVAKALPFDPRAAEVRSAVNRAVGAASRGEKSAQLAIEEILDQVNAILLTD